MIKEDYKRVENDHLMYTDNEVNEPHQQLEGNLLQYETILSHFQDATPTTSYAPTPTTTNTT